MARRALSKPDVIMSLGNAQQRGKVFGSDEDITFAVRWLVAFSSAHKYCTATRNHLATPVIAS